MTFGITLLLVAKLYVIFGLCTAVAFVMFGVTRVLSPPMSATIGARILFIPGAAALWPYVLYRWLKPRRPA